MAGEAITSPSAQLPLGMLPRSEQFDLKSEAGLTYTSKVGFPHVVDPRLKLEIKNRKPTAVYIVEIALKSGELLRIYHLAPSPIQWGGVLSPQQLCVVE